MAGKSSPTYKITLGQSWDSVELPDCVDDDELRECRAEFEKRFGIESQPESSPSKGIPAEFMSLFGSYPMEDEFSVAQCRFCGMRIKVQCLEMHISECTDIPDEVRQMMDELEEDPAPLIEETATTIPGLTRFIVLPHDHVPAPKSLPVPVPKVPTSTATAAAKSTVKPQPQTSSSSASTSSKLKPPVLQTEKELKDVKLMPEKLITPSTAAIMKSKLLSQGISATEVKPYSPPSSVEPAKPKSKIVVAEVKSPSSPTPSMMPKLKPSLILKISANTLPADEPGNSDGQAQSGIKAKTYSVSHSSVNVVGSESESLPVSPKLSPSSGLAVTPPATPVPTKASLKAMDIVEKDPPKKKKKKKSKNEPRKVIPLKERSFNPNEHCGVANTDGTQCKRSLTCKTHSMALRRAVPSRSQPFDMLLASHKKARDEAKLAKQGEDLVTVKEILNNNMKTPERVDAPITETPLSDPTASAINPNDSPRGGRTILTSLLANCSPTNITKSRPHAISPKQNKEPQSLHSRASTESKKKNKSFKYKKDDTDTIGLDLYQLETESGFVCFDDIIPPDDEVENCDVLALDSLYNSIVPFKEAVDSDVDHDLLPTPLVPILLGRRTKRHQTTRQLGPVNQFTEFTGLSAIKCASELGVDATFAMGQAYGKEIDYDYKSSDLKRLRKSIVSDQPSYTSNKKSNQGVLSNCNETEVYESSELRSPLSLTRCTDSITFLEQQTQSIPFHQNVREFSQPMEQDQIVLNEQEGYSHELKTETSTNLGVGIGMHAYSPPLKTPLKIHWKQLSRPSIKPLIGGSLVHPKGQTSNIKNAAATSHNEGLPILAQGTSTAKASSSQRPGTLTAFPSKNYPLNLEPSSGHKTFDPTAKVLEPQPTRTPMKMPSLVSSQKTIITFNMGGTITQVMSHNPSGVQYQSEDMRDQNSTWASLLEQVRVGIEQARPEDAPVADSELSKLLAAQFED